MVGRYEHVTRLSNLYLTEPAANDRWLYQITEQTSFPKFRLGIHRLLEVGNARWFVAKKCPAFSVVLAHAVGIVVVSQS